ncbi:glucosyltransferase domain-containing protein [Candidatus Arsenophonus triatominarum]|uniref:glucosyltransferase domain-containing protein n=1 Tax=Candidatus Arsenophonus triatominarum TaxID=57911 RepID=UPI0016500EB7|nr:glucosyltransferase domain-containing protein [Candidatus Arsenophonus triatominarum]
MGKIDSGCWFIISVTTLFVIPLLLSGILYQDDILRSANGEAYWSALGRPLSDFVVMAVGFGSEYVIDLFPLSLIISAAFLCVSSLVLYCRFAIKKGLSSGIVFSLFSLSPFFLQNFSYHFDCLPMMLGVFLATIPYSVVVSSFRPIFRIIVGSICLVMALSLYQATINIFLSLSAIEIIYLLYTSNIIKEILKKFVKRVITALIGVTVYMKGVTPFFLSKKVNSDLITKVDDPVKSLMHNLDRFWNIAESLLNNAMYMAWLLPILISIAGLTILIFKILTSKNEALSKIFGVSLIAFGLIVSIFSITGPFIFIDKTVVAPRVMMGLPGLMLMVGYLASVTGFRKTISFACAIPVMLSLSYASAYANASKAQRSLEDKVFYDIASSIPKSWNGKKIYIGGKISTNPATEMEFKRFPSLKWMVMPIYSWSGMIMLKYYNINANILISKDKLLKNDVLDDKRFFTLFDGVEKVILLK